MALRSFAIIFLLLFSTLFAKEKEEESIIVLPSGTTFEGDYFANGRTVEISGTVEGDLYVLGGQIFIDGTVNGNVLAAGGSVELSGRVSKNVRLLAGQGLITGAVGENITAVTATIELSPSATVRRNAVIVSGNTNIEAEVGGSVRLYSSSVRVSNAIQGKVIAYVGQLRLTSKTFIGQSLEYWSNKNALIDPHATVAEGVIHHPSFFYQFFHGKLIKGLKIGSKLTALLMNFFYSFIIGLILLRYFPHRVKKTIQTLSSKPAQSLIAGIVLLFLLPITMLILIITILGVPFALALLSLTVVGLYTAKVFFILWLSTHAFKKLNFAKHRRLYFSFGLIAYFVLTAIPYLGGVITAAALLFGIGGAVLSKMDRE